MSGDNREEFGEYNRNVDSDTIVYDTLDTSASITKRLTFETSTSSGVYDRDVDHYEEAAKVFHFLQRWISCRIYDRLYMLMADSEGHYFQDGRSDSICVADVCADDRDIRGTERTILVLESIKELHTGEACAGCMSPEVQTMIDNEILILRKKVDSLADDSNEDSDGDFL